jgi:hypothetical protein
MPGARAYHHYAYQMEPQPPFRICAVCKDLPLRSFNKTYHKGMLLQCLAVDQQQLQLNCSVWAANAHAVLRQAG